MNLGSLALAASMLTCAAPTASAEPEPKYPLVFASISEVQKLGLSLQWPMLYGKGETFSTSGLPVGCYLYAGPNTMSLISISEEFLARYTAKGFTRESLCMGLASTMKFDPETGQRIPTYIYRDDKEIDTALDRFNPETMTDDARAYLIPDVFATEDAFWAGIAAIRRKDFSGLNDDQIENLVSDADFLSNELPLKVPDCFKNGTPYLDCTWRYDLKTGEKLPDTTTSRYREVGETVDLHMKSFVAYKTWPVLDSGPYLQKRVWGLITDGSGDDPGSTWIYRATSGSAPDFSEEGYNSPPDINGGAPLEFKVGNGLAEWAEDVTWFDVSPSFPRGYGYNLTSGDEGFGDAGASAASILAAYDGASSSGRFSAARLKALLN